VFDLPELLENILLHVSTFAEAKAQIKGPLAMVWDDSVQEIVPLVHPTTYQAPSKELFVLQRVNSTFRDTISQSKIMQQRMFLAPTPGHGDIPGSSQHIYQDTISWLLSEVGVRNKKYALYGRADRVVIHKLQRDFSHFTVNTSKESSWRKMRVYNRQGCGSTVLAFADWQNPWVFDEVCLGEQLTLGSLHDKLRMMLSSLEVWYYASSSTIHWGKHFRRKGGLNLAGERDQSDLDVWT
jgi:hypothetical protein